MAYIRRLPSGRWQATIRLPSGARRSRSDPLKSVVAAWAADLEADARRGDVVDPAAGRLTVGELWPRAQAARRLEAASHARDQSHWRCHVEPRWATTPVGAIMRPDITAWVVTLERDGVGAATIQGALGVLRAVLEYAVDARIIRANPAAGVRAPRRPAHQDRVLAVDEDERLLAALDEVAPERPDGRLLVELMLYCGLRWEEAAAIDREHVLLRHALVEIGPVVERSGRIRPYPKSTAGRRQVPVPDHVWPRIRDRALATEPGGLVIVAQGGGVLDYSHWYQRVWRPALEGRPALPSQRGRAARAAIAGAALADPQPTPHDLRHTYGTRLAEGGVPPHEIMALMGHESLESVQRYLHPGEARFARARAAVAQLVPRHAARHGPRRVKESGEDPYP